MVAAATPVPAPLAGCHPFICCSLTCALLASLSLIFISSSSHLLYETQHSLRSRCCARCCALCRLRGARGTAGRQAAGGLDRLGGSRTGDANPAASALATLTAASARSAAGASRTANRWWRRTPARCWRGGVAGNSAGGGRHFAWRAFVLRRWLSSMCAPVRARRWASRCLFMPPSVTQSVASVNNIHGGAGVENGLRSGILYPPRISSFSRDARTRWAGAYVQSVPSA